MKRQILIILFTLLLILLIAIPAFAVDISNAEYYGSIIITNNSTTANNVATVMTLDSEAFLTNFGLSDNFDEVAIINSSGGNVPFGPSVNSSYPWCLWVPSIGAMQNINYGMYSGNVNGGKLVYFPEGPIGMTVPDDASIELSDNGSVVISGYIDASKNEDLATKNLAFEFYSTGDGELVASIENYTASDNFSGDRWVDVGTLTHVDTTNRYLTYDAIRGDNIDNSCYWDRGSAISDTNWVMDFEWTPVSAPVVNNSIFTFGWQSTISNYNGVQDFLGMALVQPNIVYLTRKDATVQGLSSSITITHGTKYYVTLIRNAADLATMHIYSDPGRTTDITGSPVTLAVPVTVTTLQYLTASNYKEAVNSGEETGYIDRLGFANSTNTTSTTVATSGLGLTNGDYEAKAVLDSTDIKIYLDGVEKATKALGGTSVPNNDSDYVFSENDIMPYIESAEIDVGGVPVSAWAWEYDTTLHDSIGSNDATPQFRTASSNANVSASLSSYQPVNQAVSTVTPSSSWPEILTTAPTEPATTYTSNSTPGFFFEPVIRPFLTLGNIPQPFFWTNFCFFIIILAGMIVYRIHPSLIIKDGIMTALMIWFAAAGLNVYGMYVPLYFIMGCFGIIVLSRSYGL